MDEELKPCPFCGSYNAEAIRQGIGASTVQCRTCYAYGPRVGWELESDMDYWIMNNPWKRDGEELMARYQAKYGPIAAKNWNTRTVAHG